MNAMSKKSGGGGCGCGAGSKSSACGCGGGQTGFCACGDVGCATCQNQGFVRPRFFAGQLLTEEDLQQLIDYVVGKNRLHNQRLWGDGVVCGLEVSCNPCGGGTVIVNPGYALDCCGNDLLLVCPQELDINAMVRDLKRNLLGGYDCGDPCAEKKKETKKSNEGTTTIEQPTDEFANVRPTPAPTESSDQEEESPPETTRHYCLYIRYCENQTEPVSPYATDEGCNFQACQPTRVSEGVRFELRCDDSCRHETDIRERICDCLGDPDSAYQSTRSANYFSAVGRLSSPMRALSVVANPGESPELAELRQASVNFFNSLEPLRARQPMPQPTTTLASHVEGQPEEAKAAEAFRKPAVSAADFDGVIQEIREATVHLARYYVARNKVRQLDVEIPAGTPSEDEIQKAKSEILPIVNAAQQLIKDLPVIEQERTFYSVLLKRSELLIAGNEPQDEIGPEALQLTNKGFLVGSADLLPSARSLAALREELLDRLDRSPRLGDCQLRADVLGLRVPDQNTTESGWSKSSLTVSKAWLRYVKDCFCAALNPPCVPCEDPAVLLACVEVRECEVAKVCNIKRKFVLSPTALRYWLPPLNDLGEQIEKLCCPEIICEDDDVTASDPKNRLLGMSLHDRYATRLPGRLNPLIFLLLCGRVKRATYLQTLSTKQKLDMVRMLKFSTIAPATPLEKLISFLLPELEQPALVTTTSQPFGRSAFIEALQEREMRASVVAALAPEFRSEVATSLDSDEIRNKLRALVAELVPSPQNITAMSTKIDELATAMSREKVNEYVAEALKAEGGPTSDAIAGIADDSVAAAVDKLKLASSIKDLKEVKRIKSENAELKKSLAAVEARLKKLEGGT